MVLLEKGVHVVRMEPQDKLAQEVNQDPVVKMDNQVLMEEMESLALQVDKDLLVRLDPLDLTVCQELMDREVSKVLEVNVEKLDQQVPQVKMVILDDKENKDLEGQMEGLGKEDHLVLGEIVELQVQMVNKEREANQGKQVKIINCNILVVFKGYRNIICNDYSLHG